MSLEDFSTTSQGGDNPRRLAILTSSSIVSSLIRSGAQSDIVTPCEDGYLDAWNLNQGFVDAIKKGRLDPNDVVGQAAQLDTDTGQFASRLDALVIGEIGTLQEGDPKLAGALSFYFEPHPSGYGSHNSVALYDDARIKVAIDCSLKDGSDDTNTLLLAEFIGLINHTISEEKHSENIVKKTGWGFLGKFVDRWPSMFELMNNLP